MMRDYPYKKLDAKIEDFEFTRKLFISSRHSITSVIDCENLYSFSKKNNFSFFNLCVAAIYRTIESIPELKQCFIEGEAREYEHINVILPLGNEDHTVNQVCIESIHDFNSFRDWDDFLMNVKNHPEDYEYKYGPESVNHVFAILSCIPWIHYSSFEDMTLDSDTFFPAIYWGKYVDGKIPVTLTSNHIFVYGYQLGLFFNRLSEYMENPETLFESF